MECDKNKEKLSYHVDLTQVVDGKVQEVFNFNFGGHHDLAALAQFAAQKENLSDKHARELVLGLRFLHHVLKKYPDNQLFADFLVKLNEFKRELKGKGCGCGGK